MVKNDHMNVRNTILFLAFLLTVTGIKAQDLHFTQFQFAPLTFNPALTGAYAGSYRLGGIYRDQYRTVATNAFQTLSFMVDAPVIRGFREQDWIGVGVGMDAFDKAGAAGFKRSYYRLNGAYHFSLDKNQTNILTIGLQYTTTSLSFDRNSFNSINNPTPFQLGGGNAMSDTDWQRFIQKYNREDAGDSYGDYIVGVMFNSRGTESDLKLGVSAARILSPRVTIDQINELDLRLALFGIYNMQLSDKTSFTPAFLFQSEGPASELEVQGQLGYLIKPDKGIRLNGGLGYRLGDAIQFLVGMDYKDFRVGLAYDMNVSGLSAASSMVGGFELGLAYYGKIHKKPKVKPVIVCPRL